MKSNIDFGFALSAGLAGAGAPPRTPETFHDWVQYGLPSSCRVYSATRTSWRTPLSSTRPETPYLPSRPWTVVAAFLIGCALILPLLAGTPAICGIVSMLTRSDDF